MNKHSLGRGMAAFFPDLSLENKEEVSLLPLAEIRPNPYQPRHQFNEEALNELAQSIQEHGLLQPILVRPSDIYGYEIIAGERRYRACEKLQKAEIPALVRNITDEEMHEWAILENLQREDLTPLEEANSYKSLMETSQLTQEEVAERLGKSRSYIANYLRLLMLPKDLQEAVAEKKLSVGQARAVLGLKSEAEQRAFAQEIQEKNLTVRQVEARLKELKCQKKKLKSSRPQISAYAQKVSVELSACLNLPVEVKTQGKKIQIEFASLVDFERYLNSLGLSTMEEE